LPSPNDNAGAPQSEFFGLLAGALAGRPPRKAGRRLHIAGGDGPVYTDGITLWMPEQNGEDLLAPVVVQAGLLAAGSLDRRLMVRLIGRRSAAARFTVLEASRLSQVARDVLPPRVERRLQTLGVSPVPTSAEESLERALSGESVTARPDIVGLLRPSTVLRARASTGEHLDDSGLRDERLEKLRDVTNDVQEADDDEGDGLKDTLASGFSKNPIAKLLRELLEPETAAARSGDDGDMAELAVGGMRRVWEMGGRGQISAYSVDLAAPDEHSSRDGTEHPEWDGSRRRYRPRYCCVHHMDPAPPETRSTLRLAPDPELRRVFARLGLGLERHGRLQDGEELDLRALVDYAVARAAGSDPDDRVYASRRPTAHDLGVLVLLDASGSTGDAQGNGERIWDDQRALTASLVDALEGVGDRVAAYAFRSYHRRDVRFLRIKHFDDRFDHGAQRRLIDLDPAGYTRMGAAIRHGSLLARQQSGTARHLLILVSDGLPYEEGYERRYAEQDCHRALQEAVESGVGCVCLSVGTAQDEASLDRIWGATSHAHVDHSRDIPARAEALVRTALRTAADASHGLATPSHTRKTPR
jgi:nitric oxide reductase NorD protein